MTSIFSPDATKAIVDRYVADAMATVPEGKKMVVVGYWNTDGIWRVGIAKRSEDGRWTFAGHVGADFADGNIDVNAGFVVRWTS